MENSDKNIGDLVQGLPISQSAKERIGKLFVEDSYLKNILLEYGHFPNDLQRFLNLQGFQAKTLKIKALEKIGTLINSDKEFVWNFYRSAIVKYLIKEMPSLQKLLKEVKIPNRPYTSTELLLEIKKNALAYQVPETHIINLYRYWLFETLEDESSIFQQIAKSTSSQDISRPINKPADQGSNITKEDPKKLAKSIEANLRGIIGGLKKEAKDSQSKLNTLIEKNKTETTSALEALQKKITKINHKEVFYESEFQKLKNEIRDNSRHLENLVESTSKSLKLQIEESCNRRILEVQTNLNARVDELITNFNEGSKHINNSETKLQFTDDRKRTVARHEENFVNAWSEFLADECGLNFSADEAMYAHTAYKSCNYLITDQYSILDSWLKFIGFNDFTNLESVEPLWISRMEWYGTLKHLEAIDDKIKLAVFRNFNVAMTNSYLYPILDKWTAAGTSKNHKIFLIPSNSQEDTVNHKEIIQLAPTLNLTSVKITSDGEWTKHHGINLNKNLPAINVSTFRSWIKESSPTDNRNELIEIPSRQLGIILPETLLTNYNSIVSNLNKYFDLNESKTAAIQMSFMPYIREYYSKEVFEDFVTLIKGYL